MQHVAPARPGAELAGAPAIRGRFSTRMLAGILVAVAIGGLLRGIWLTADPPVHTTVGIVWHDEGAWVHNARNRALWGTWRTDEWNPVFVAPVFTALEYAAFELFGVGTWQARTVPLASGLLAIVAIAVGLAAMAGPRAALVGAILLATNYVFVMWNRAALMESTMTACIVASWACYARAGARHPAWGLAAGAFATLAWFTKAAAAFFVLAIVLDAVVILTVARVAALRRVLRMDRPAAADVRAALMTLAGLLGSAAVIAAIFVLPYWSEYRFYNWQMSVTRKPSYTIRALVDRASWLPMVHDSFTRMWVALVAAALATVGILMRLRRAVPAERLLVLWFLLGIVELIVHDAGNERRYVMLIPALIALAAALIGSPRVAPAAARGTERWLALPTVVLLLYLIFGAILRMLFLGDVKEGDLAPSVRLSIACAMAAGTIVVWKWGAIAAWLSRQAVPARALAVLVGVVVIGDLAQYAQWAGERTYLNYQASMEVGRLVPAGTLVHGKLANGLALENRIRPIFVGRGFGNYRDRTSRDDVRYILTYTSPSVGYEGDVIRDVLAAYPHLTTIASFPVAETPGGHDRAALLDKFGNSAQANTARRANP